MHILNRTTQNIPAQLPIKVMQFGGGNFLRAFVDWMIQILNEETDFNGGVAVIKPTERGDYNELKTQDGLFTVILDGVKKGQLIAEKKLVSVVQKVVNPYTEWDAYLKLAEREELKFIVSNTTEAGIRFNPDDKFTGTPPTEFPAKLTKWLHHRYLFFGGNPSKGCILLPCELIENNGHTLKETVLKYADHWNLNPDFKAWIASANHFCGTLVDRIVSGYPQDRAEEIELELGYGDKLLVAGEYYHSWVIQGSQEIQKKLPFAQTDLNVQFVEDLVPYRKMKVRILNGAHTAMVPVGYLGGLRLVRDVMQEEITFSFVENLLTGEVIKTLDFPVEIKRKFVQEVMDRYRNPLIDHQLISISLNGTSKFVTRLLPALKGYRALTGTLPARIVFSLAALILFYKGEFNGEEIELKDNKQVLDFFQDHWRRVIDGNLTIEELAQSILANKLIWGENLNNFPGMTEMVSHYIAEIEANGVMATLRTIETG
ncbi:tagaturonate reductase [Flavobacteriaceae bacterium F89]|uniref:Tagaturonate reductase n=1 Tax=Cerina litoralis TaxID=2874477 RepID=A0AAE3JQR3_9FLAO|nr:tagaturonate reductase [Cerina litoralis]MCG2460498.1 tagaturonate reductase [Cerina litoralis]